ncbi:gene transfer agent family protein [Loktanella sp. SALINAS62]|uniref:gene transfer agent family protein n=1 Tax=Loktanella sp. SALINAS62 TaxID=2706124 RepID=UPI001B8D67DA|nr:gene transfer agent family protein [Loktanella sp. SALINAS62]MBS1303589.1 gene transfer agent family protein [Loktanella sp. SALINAS62]
MVNPCAGEVAVTIDGECFVAKLTLGALASLEAELDTGTLIDLVERFETGRYRGRDVLALIVAGLQGGGWRGCADDLLSADIAGGPVGAATVAAQLLSRAFTPPP